MTRLRTSTVASFVRSLESISGKASLLPESQTYLGSPDRWQAGFARYRAATPKPLQDAGRKLLPHVDSLLGILPFGDLAARGVEAELMAVPAPAAGVLRTVPHVKRAQAAHDIHRGGARVPG